MWFFSSEQKDIAAWVKDFSKKTIEPGAALRDEQELHDPDIYKKVGEAGLLGPTIATDWGGLGGGAIEACLIIENIAYADASIALSYLAHSILALHQIYIHSTEDQKEHFIPSLLTGNSLAGMGMTEPGAGSDVLGMKTFATATENGFEISGSKTWITNAPIGDLFYCYARTSPERNGISSFIVTKDCPGFFKGKKLSKMGMKASMTGELFFDRCHIPAHYLIGKLHQGIPAMMKNLDLERITISAISLGIAEKALALCSSYAKERQAFGRPIGAYQQIQERIAEGYSKYLLCKSLTYETAKMWDLKILTPEQASLRSASVKLQSAQMATRVTLDAIQILGGYGYSKEYTVERLMRDAKLIEIGAGTNEILRIIISRNLLGRDIVTTY